MNQNEWYIIFPGITEDSDTRLGPFTLDEAKIEKSIMIKRSGLNPTEVRIEKDSKLGNKTPDINLRNSWIFIEPSKIKDLLSKITKTPHLYRVDSIQWINQIGKSILRNTRGKLPNCSPDQWKIIKQFI